MFHICDHAGALTAGINYYRAILNLESSLPPGGCLDGTDGMYVLGEHEKYISMESLALTAKEYPKIRVEIVPDANHFLQEHKPNAVNELLRDFFESAAKDCPIESLL